MKFEQDLLYLFFWKSVFLKHPNVHLIFVSAQIWDIHFVHYDEAALNIKWQISRHGNSITLLQCFRPLLSINVHSLGFVKNLPVGSPLWILLYHPISFQGKHIARAYDIIGHCKKLTDYGICANSEDRDWAARTKANFCFQGEPVADDNDDTHDVEEWNVGE